MLEVEIHQRGDTRLPYALQELPGSDVLLVGFPKLRHGVVKPAVAMRKHVRDVPAHKLYLGSDAYQFVGPTQQMHGAKAALELVEELRSDLGVPRKRVVFFGTSYGAVISCILGLMHGGLVLAGAPPIAMGTAVGEWAQSERIGRKVGASSFVALGEGGNGFTPIEWLDTLVPRLARAARHPVRMRFTSGPDDYGWLSTLEFVASTIDMPLVDATIDVQGEERHADVARSFWALLPALLEREIGLAV